MSAVLEIPASIPFQHSEPPKDDSNAWFKELLAKCAVSTRAQLEEIFSKYDALHAEDVKRFRAEWEERLTKFDIDTKAILADLDALIERHKTPTLAVLPDPYQTAVDKVLNYVDPEKQFSRRAIAPLPKGLEGQIERFKDEIREVCDVVKDKGRKDTKLLVHLADTNGMRYSRNLDIAHKSAFIVYTGARQSGIHLSLGAGLYADVLNPDHSVKEVSALNRGFNWFSRKPPETFEKMLFAQRAMLDRNGEASGYTHVVFVADDSLKLGNKDIALGVIVDMTARHPNIKWDVVELPTDKGKPGALKDIAGLLPSLRRTTVPDLNTLPALLAEIAVTPFGLPVTIAREAELRTENLLLRHAGR